MSAISEARKPVLVLIHPRSNREDEEDLDREDRRLNRNGWIAVAIAALLLAVLLSFAKRADPDVLSRVDESALVN